MGRPAERIAKTGRERRRGKWSAVYRRSGDVAEVFGEPGLVHGGDANVSDRFRALEARRVVRQRLWLAVGGRVGLAGVKARIVL